MNTYTTIDNSDNARSIAFQMSDSLITKLAVYPAKGGREVGPQANGPLNWTQEHKSV